MYSLMKETLNLMYKANLFENPHFCQLKMHVSSIASVFSNMFSPVYIHLGTATCKSLSLPSWAECQQWG